MNTLRFSLGLLAATVLAACNPSAQQTATPAPAASNTATSAPAPTASGEVKKIAITSIVEHPSLDAIRKGVLDQLKQEGFEEGKNLTVDFQSAQGNPSTAAQIAKKFAGDNPDVIVAIATPSAQAVVAATKTIPVVFAGITDPIGAKLVASWEPSGTNVTGTSNQHSLEPDLALMRDVVPNLKQIGYVYSPGEANSVSTLNALREEAKKYGIEVVEAPAQTTSNVLTAARSLKDKVQVLYTAHDNNVVAAYESMYKAAVEMKIPLIASDTKSVERGAAAAVGVDDYKIGLASGKMAAQILNGTTAGSIAPTKPTEFELHLNPKFAAEQGVQFNDDLRKRATRVIE
ncbi:ABC transporter substrate-binding protein [Kingella kingae]|uniref:ABC transporter substrate-binding protein n=2 Tax=Kingella kingae TaxID=504 RepID=UPI0002585A52|nr:ABC transporter substrate-binding protein [Kingella kingae]EIC13503.1 putative ABC transport system substrate-binding protein [Kingella kingae PYKK081]MBD3614288.1 ABC transporter substrate-binding protein [Kingella kingae]MBD3632537.1 ABC transporter substrate-binding protein [Kingella kingae]MBD3659947.1 ABC transporter substrate-binding protein [Kingella kingae]MDK4547431.1 ABC transporter substrate-binding protein [Kingella kingae]